MLAQPHIIVGTDFSPCSDRAIRVGEKWRQKTNGSLHVVYIHKYSDESNYKESIKEELASRVSQQVKKCEAQCSQEILFGDPYKMLTETISRKSADILMLGHQGVSAHPWQIGGLVSKMASSCTVPMVVVKKDGEIKKLAGLIEPADLCKRVFRTSEEVSALFTAMLEFFSIVPDIYSENLGIAPFFPTDKFYLSQDEKIEMQKNIRQLILEEVDPKASPIIKVMFNEKGRLSDTLARFLEAEMVDLAVALRHRKGKLENFFLGSVTRGLMESYSGNLLILPPV